MSLLRLADASPEQAKALVKLLSETAKRLGMADHSYIVGGAPRDWALGHDFKDVDVVVEPKNGKNAVTLAEEVAKQLGNLSVKADQYGVVHVGPVKKDIIYDGVNLKDQKIEIVTSRKEKYDKGSHKPSQVEPGTILEDLLRRDFTFNALVWRLLDVASGPDKSLILDLTGMGMRDLQKKIVRTPLNPAETFSDDPSRMLRAVRFAIKYGFELDPATRKAIKSKAKEIKRMPYEAVDGILFDKILPLPGAKKALSLMKGLGLLDPLIEMIPANRFRRALSERAPNIDLLLTLAGFDIPTGLDKLTKPQLRLLRRMEGKLPLDDLEDVYRRLVKPPLDMRQFMKDTGLKGKALGEVQDRARDIILDTPFIRAQELQRLVTEDVLAGRDRLARRVSERYRQAKDVEELLIEELDPENVEAYIEGLVESIDNLEGAEKDLGLDLRGMTKLLRELDHSDDLYHNGETVLDHIKWVMQDVHRLTKDKKDQELRGVLSMAALLHDLGKAYTHKVDSKGKHTFHGHAQKSVAIAEKMVGRLRKKNADLAELIVQLVKHHDSFLSLINARRSGQTKSSLKYLNKFMREAIYTKGHLKKLLMFTKADSSRSKAFDETLMGIDEVLEDLKKVEGRAAEEARELANREKRIQQSMGAIRLLLEAEAPDVLGLLPDLRAVKRQLGQNRRYEVLENLKLITGK